MFLEDEKLNPCECGAQPCVPGIRLGPTLLNFDKHCYRVVCLACWVKGQSGRTIADATRYWNDGYGESRLRTIRLEMGMTQPEIAEMCGVATNTIWRYENGLQTPMPETREKIESVLGKVW